MTTNMDSINQNDIRARELLQAWFNEHGINPVIRLNDLGDGDASLELIEGFATYTEVAEVINAHGTQACDAEDKSSINDAIYGEYEHFSRIAAEQIKDETKESEDINDGSQRESWLHTWEGKNGYYFCFSGVNRDGMYSESEDVGPFESREDAREYALADEESE